MQKKSTRSKHHATTHNRRTINYFSKKEGLLFFADRPAGSSYRPRRVESKGAAGIPRQPITSRFVGYPTFAGRPCGWGAASIPPQRSWGKSGVSGGFDTQAESQWADLFGPSIPAEKINHTTINRRGPLYVRRIGHGTERRPCLWRRKLGGIFDAWGGWKAWPIGDRAVHSNGSARSHSIKTPQSTSFRLGWG
jgi:hypothetical protein